MMEMCAKFGWYRLLTKEERWCYVAVAAAPLATASPSETRAATPRRVTPSRLALEHQTATSQH